MQSSFRYLATLLLLFTVTTLSARWGKISPWLRLKVDKYHQEKIQRQASPRLAPENENEEVVLFLQTWQPLSDEDLAEYQCRRYAQLDDIAIIKLPLSQMEALSNHPMVRLLEANTSSHVTNDTIPFIVNTKSVYEATSQCPAFTGDGVVFGIMDVGFDLTHPTFYRDIALSDYRISALWDMLASSDEDDNTLPVGREYTSKAALLEHGCSTDSKIQTHGTHTAGTGAGSGYDSPYRGVAFDSDICMVSNAVTDDSVFVDKKNYYKYTTATDALGLKYIFDYAERQHKPCVISFSEGYTPLPCADDSLHAAFISKLLGPGRIFVSSAGNQGRFMSYASKPREAEMAGTFIQCYKNKASYSIVTDGLMDIRLYVYDKQTSEHIQTLEMSMTGAAPDSVQWSVQHLNDHDLIVKLSRYVSSINPNDTVYQLDLSADITLSNLAHLALVVAGSDSRAEIFGSSSSMMRSRPEVDSRWDAADNGHNILAPGCFDAAICVGATGHRMSYVNADKDTITFSGKPGVLGDYSSTGPAINGHLKPDVTAPGTNVISSCNSYYFENNPTATGNYVSYSEHDGRQYPWGANSGTSMSTPVVAGTIALWLQANPTLTREDIIGIFSRSCRHLEPSLSYPNNQYGYGEIDAYRGLLDILGLTRIETISQQQPDGVQIYAKNKCLHLRFSKLTTHQAQVSIYTVAGTLQYQTQLSAGQTEVTIPLATWASGIYAVQFTSRERSMSGSQLIRL